MPTIQTPLTLRALYTRVFKNFETVRNERQAPLADRLAIRVPSTTEFNTYAWMASFPKFREWYGARHVKGIGERKFEVRNKDYELTIGLPRNEVLDRGEVGYAQFVAEGMAREGAKLPNDLVIDLLMNGHTRPAYDGQNFFDTDHPTNLDAITGTQSNYSASGMALTAANYAAVRAAMMGYANEDGRPLGVMPNLLIVPPQLESMARSILNADLVANAAGTAAVSNPYVNSAELMVVPEFAGQGTTWYLADTTDALKPFVIQERQAPRLVMKDKETDDNLFWHKEMIMGSDARYGAGYGAWQRIYKAAA